jgi:hypothetical protein
MYNIRELRAQQISLPGAPSVLSPVYAFVHFSSDSRGSVCALFQSLVCHVYPTSAIERVGKMRTKNIVRAVRSCDPTTIRANTRLCEISSSHGGEYEVQICLLGYIAV